MIQVKSRGRYEYYTPLKIINMAREVMGDIDLDPATSEMAQSHVEAKRYFTIEDDGLKQEWAGRVWMNPPFTVNLAGAFINKLLVSSRVTESICLLCLSPDSAPLCRMFAEAELFCWPAKRFKFWRPQANKWQSPAHTLLFYRGPNGDKFREVFGKLGVVR